MSKLKLPTGKPFLKGLIRLQTSGLITAFCAGLLAACTSTTKTAPFQGGSSHSTAHPPVQSSALTHEKAITRFKQIGKTSYVLWFGLDETAEDFQGRTVVLFDLKPKAHEVSDHIEIDLEEANLRSLSINGTAVSNLTSKQRYDGHHLSFSLSELSPSGNRIEISYSHPYSRDGNGFHRFRDPIDNRVYLYSNFEPYKAHRLFPCFDQPDLKATYELTVDAPQDWTVIANTLERDVALVDGRKSWAFPPTSVFSTYVFALHAGPYSSWKSEANGIPIRLFARQSLAQHVDSKEWFEITRSGLDFFSLQFGFPYPFTKYDQILVPDFNAGAMENVGAVTFSENYVFRTKVTRDRHRWRANTILHEMAHMWFGDLVTMRWWNGLWLNESFATLMSHWAVEEATQFKGNWQSFFAGSKQWAYWEDQLVTTHPIELPVHDTHQAEANFDGITYGKGASVLKQLRFYIGVDDFREGLQRYFQKYAYRNTGIGDFIHMLSEASGHDLQSWQKVWLQTSGPNTLKAEWKCDADPDDGKKLISEFNLLQSTVGETAATDRAPDNTLRPHRTRIALYSASKHRSSALGTPSKVLDTAYTGANTPVPNAKGLPCPDFVFPNYDDEDFVKIDFDSVSLAFIFEHLDRLSEPFLRQMIWHSLWQMVVDGKLRSQDYASLVMNHAGHEHDTQILNKILGTLYSPSANMGTALKYAVPSLREGLRSKIEKFLESHLLKASPGSDLQLIWFNRFLQAAHSPESLQMIEKIYSGKKKISGMKIDQERKWDLVTALARNGAPHVSELLKTELKNDPSDSGNKHFIAAEASIPDAEIKKSWLAKILRAPTTGEALPIAKLREAMSNYRVFGQEELTNESIDSYFLNLPKFAQSGSVEDDVYSKNFADSMFPSLCDPEISKRITALLEANPDMVAGVIKTLKIARQEEERCIRARTKSAEPEQTAKKGYSGELSLSHSLETPASVSE